MCEQASFVSEMIMDYLLRVLALPALVLTPAVIAVFFYPRVRVRAGITIGLVILHLVAAVAAGDLHLQPGLVRVGGPLGELVAHLEGAHDGLEKIGLARL